MTFALLNDTNEYFCVSDYLPVISYWLL